MNLVKGQEHFVGRANNARDLRFILGHSIYSSMLKDKLAVQEDASPPELFIQSALAFIDSVI